MYSRDIFDWKQAELFYWTGVNLFAHWNADVAIASKVIASHEDKHFPKYDTSFDHDIAFNFQFSDKKGKTPDFVALRNNGISGIITASNGIPIKINRYNQSGQWDEEIWSCEENKAWRDPDSFRQLLFKQIEEWQPFSPEEGEFSRILKLPTD